MRVTDASHALCTARLRRGRHCHRSSRNCGLNFGALLLAGYLVAENWLGPTIAVLLQSVAQSAARTLRR